MNVKNKLFHVGGSFLETGRFVAIMAVAVPLIFLASFVQVAMIDGNEID